MRSRKKRPKKSHIWECVQIDEGIVNYAGAVALNEQESCLQKNKLWTTQNNQERLPQMRKLLFPEGFCAMQRVHEKCDAVFIAQKAGGQNVRKAQKNISGRSDDDDDGAGNDAARNERMPCA